MKSELNYRPEIDGLRAIAVLSVILFHAEFVISDLILFKGGFFGVDIFFVISGYLISFIILKRLERGTFSFVDFYERRAKRILPVLLTVALTSIPFAWICLSPRALVEYSNSILYSIFFSSNINLWQEDSYWAIENKLRPFLHTWSLGVEEQFYIIMPILLLIFWKYARNSMFTLFVFMGLFSLQLADFLSPRFPDFSFYMLPTRMWELMAGTFLAILESKYGRKNQNWMNLIFPPIGLFLIGHSLIFFDKNTIHPSFQTLIPILGTMFIIWFSHPKELTTHLLSNKLFVGIGLISYGLYLWHYPIFAFARIIGGIPSAYDKIGCLVLSLIVSIATYFLIEKPFRTKLSSKKVIIILSVISLIIIAILIFFLNTNGRAKRYAEWQIESFSLDKKNDDFNRYVTEKYNAHARGKNFHPNKRPNILLMGDSFSQDFYNILIEKGFSKKAQIVSRFMPSECILFFSTAKKDIEKKFKDPKRNKRCSKIKRIGDEKLNSTIRKSDGVILAVSWTKEDAKNIPKVIEEINSLGVNNILIVGSKNFPAIKTQALWRLDKKQIISLRKKISKYVYSNIQFMEKMNLPGYLNIHKVMCGDDDKCPISTPDGFLISFDSHHLTEKGVKYIGNKIIYAQEFTNFWMRVERANSIRAKEKLR